MSKTMKKFTLAVLAATSILMCVSCGNQETIDGKWVLTKKEFTDGTVIEGDDLSTYESYEIDGENGVFTSVTDELGTKSFDVTVDEIEENEYQFKISGKLDFSTGTLDGKQLVVKFDDGTVFYYDKE